MKITNVHWIFLTPKVTTPPEYVEEPKGLHKKYPVSRTNIMGGQYRGLENDLLYCTEESYEESYKRKGR